MSILVENIEAARLRQGIDDVDLRGRISALTAEDRVRVSISGDGKIYEEVSVRITSRKGERFRGKLATKVRQASLKSAAIGSTVFFEGNQIHSIIASKNRAPQSLATCFPARVEKDRDEVPAPRRFVRTVPPAAPVKSRARSNRALRIRVDGNRRFIQVPTGIAKDLHQYLRSCRVHSAPPQPYLSDADCIELNPTIDVPAVQALLDVWQR